jgi:formate hydrogenlyase subunit 3/multisubunit Na+/H+ antiporter MnhD subunit
MQYNLLLLLVAGPIAVGLSCLFFPDKARNIPKAAAVSVTLASFVLSIYVFANKPLNWTASGLLIFSADNLSALIALAVSFFAFLVAIYSYGFIDPSTNAQGQSRASEARRGIDKSYGPYFGYLLITLGSSFGAAFANNLMVLLAFWGILAAMLYLMVNIKGTAAASASAKKALIIIGGTDALMMLGIAIIWLVTGTFSMEKIRLSLDTGLAVCAYAGIAIAAFAKAGAMPFHSWLPDVAEDGPTPVAAYLPASLDKLLGIYLLARASLSLFVMNAASNLILAVVGSVTIVFAVMMALVQHDMKRLLGYHAVSQVGYMVLGISTATPIGIAGALFHMLNNAIYKSCLFLGGGNVEKRTDTSDLESLGGLAKFMPVTFASFLIASLAISGVPPTNGFVSKWMIYQGIIESAGREKGLWIIWLSAAMFGSALTVASFMKLLHAVFLGRPSKGHAGLKEAPLGMWAPAVILAAVCVVFGVFAFTIPIALFIAPAVDGRIAYLGAWSPVAATGLILIALAAGALLYLLSRAMKYRTVTPFVGGENAETLGRISGTEFYNTIKEIKWIRWIYRKEETKTLDIYEAGSRGTFAFSKALQWLHNGILPTYLAWCLIGMLALFLVLVRK